VPPARSVINGAQLLDCVKQRTLHRGEDFSCFGEQQLAFGRCAPIEHDR